MNMPFGRKSPLEALALPGIILAYKYSQFRQRRREAASKRVTERELSALHSKIDKLLNKLDDTEPDPPTSQENECVICINARATMQTSPCGHCVVCRRCFVKTIQSAVAQRLLPLRCVICRARVNRLTSISGTWSMPESASSYVLNGKTRYSDNVSEYRLPLSASSSSSVKHVHGYSRSHSERHWSVSNSASLYSMSSTGSSLGYSHTSRNSVSSKTSSSSYGLSSTCTTPVTANNATSPESEISKHHLTPILSRPQRSITLPSGSQTLSSAISPPNPHHSHCTSCPSNCSGAVPRKPLNGGHNGMPRSHTVSFSNTTTHTYPGRRSSSRGRTVNIKSHLPPIEEFNSPAKVPHPSPVHISNPRFRYASYTKTHGNTGETNFGSPYFKASGSKVCPATTKEKLPKMAFINNGKTHTNNESKTSSITKRTISTNENNVNVNKVINKNCNKEKLENGDNNTNTNTNNNNNCNKKAMPANDMKTSPSIFSLSTLLVNYKIHFQHNTSSSRKNLNFLFKNNHKDKNDTKNLETYEMKKRDEKLKQKTERDIRKEEKRRAKEEERIAKATAKEDKKFNKNK